jgi:hypothetical protein
VKRNVLWYSYLAGINRENKESPQKLAMHVMTKFFFVRKQGVRILCNNAGHCNAHPIVASIVKFLLSTSLIKDSLAEFAINYWERFLLDRDFVTRKKVHKHFSLWRFRIMCTRKTSGKVKRSPKDLFDLFKRVKIE